MIKKKTVGVVVPTYNEEKLIGRTLSTIPKFVDKIYVINDGSTDSSVAEIKKIKDRRILLISHEKNRGLGAAIKTGYKKALEDNIDVTAVMAGDNQMDPLLLKEIIDPVIERRADYSKGNRIFDPKLREGMPKFRFVGNTILTLLTKISSGYWHIMDPQNGYTAISLHALKNIDIDTIFDYYGYNNDILTKLNVKNMRAEDVLMPARYGSEASKINYKKYIVKVGFRQIKNFFWRLKNKYFFLNFHPLVLFYIFGIILTPVGFIAMLYSIFGKMFYAEPIFIRLTLSTLLFIMGILFFSFAMLFDMQENKR